jgi:hypothetical protein
LLVLKARTVDKGYAEGKEIYYTYTEASDAELAEKMAAGV